MRISLAPFISLSVCALFAGCAQSTDSTDCAEDDNACLCEIGDPACVTDGSGGAGGGGVVVLPDGGKAGAKAGNAGNGGTRPSDAGGDAPRTDSGTGGAAGTGGTTGGGGVQPGTGGGPQNPWPVPLVAGMPAHFAVGLGESGTGDTWMQKNDSGWDFRYKYFTNGWEGWNYMPGWLNETNSQGFVPVISYYALVGVAGSEANEYATIKDAGKMWNYFTSFKNMLANVKSFGKPVLVMVEADGFGFIQTESQNTDGSDNPGAYAAVKSSGLSELSGLPDTVAGWGMAFLELRKATGATNAALGIHISQWSSWGNIPNDPTSNLQGGVTNHVKFVNALGVAPNQTGATWDYLIGDPSDRDADFYKVTKSDPSHWWDVSDTAAVKSASFIRYMNYLSLFYQQARKRWILWQIPCGNSNSPNTCNGGYKDNRAEYWFTLGGDGGAKHRQMFKDAGVAGLLFGAGAGCNTSFGNDYWTDGQPFLKTHVATYYQNPLALP